MRGHRRCNTGFGGWRRTPPPPPGSEQFGPGFGASRRSLYRSRRGKFMGVCQGLAERFGLNVFWVRVAVVLLAFMTGFWPVLGIYLIIGFIMRPAPVEPLRTDDERSFYNSYVKDRSAALARLKEKFQGLESRIRRMEDQVTSKEYDWDRRMGQSTP